MTEQLTLEQEQILNQDWVKNIKYAPLYGYSKVFHYKKEKGTHLTGTVVFSQTLSKILIVDVDNKAPYEQAQENLEQLKQMFVPENTSDVYVEQTGNLGLHIFLYNDLFDESYLKQVDQCRFCELFKKQFHNFDIDIFTPSSSPKKSQVDVAKPHCDGLHYLGEDDECRVILNRSDEKTTKVKDVKGNIVALKIISECQNFVFTKLRASQYLQQILSKTGIDIKFAFVKRFDEAKMKENHLKCKSQNTIQKSEKQEEQQDQTQTQNESLQNCISLILSLLTDAEIHNFSGTNIKQEISLLPLFRSIMVLPEEEQQKTIEQLYNVSNLTPNAKKNYFSTWERVKNTYPAFNDLGIFFQMIKHNCPKRYKDLEDEVKKVQQVYSLKSNNGLEKIITMNNQIDFSESIIFEQVFKKRYIKDNYFIPEDWFLDVQKVLYYNIQTSSYYKKTKMNFGENNYYLEEISFQKIQDVLQDFKIDGTILVNYLNEMRMYIEYDRVMLSLTDNTKNEFPIFRSFPYIGEQRDELLQIYFDHIREIICNSDEILFKYILDLFAFYIQYPISQSGVVLVITGPQGNGKNSLTTPLLKLMGAYGKEVNDINHVLGQFNPILEATHLLVCDEMVQCDYATKKANFDRMKTLITSPQIYINQKSEKPRFVGNMLNFIFLSNHNRPVIIEETNRRYCVIKTSPRRESEYYDRLYNSFEQKGFYEALMHFLQTRDISKFKPQNDMPITKETMDIIQMSLSPIEQFVYGLQLSHFPLRVLYANFTKFMKEFYPNGQIMNCNNFNIELQQYYEEKRINNKRIRILKEEFKQESRKMDIDFDVLTSEQSNNM